MVLPDAGTKLRMVLDYLPCEACLAQPVADQDLLCTVCARVEREVAVRVGTRTTVILERPTPEEAPIVIAPAPPMPEPPPAPREMVVRWADEASAGRPGAIEIVVEPLSPAPVALPLVAEAAPAAEAEEPEFSVDDIAEYLPPASEFFDFTRPEPDAYARPPSRREERREEPAPAFAPPAVEEEPPAPQDDFVFRPPREEEAAPPPPAEEEIIPAEEVAVESTEDQERWAPPADLLPDEPLQEDASGEPEEEVLEMEVVADDDEDIVEMEVMEDEPGPQPAFAPPPPPSPPPAAPPAQRAEAGSGDLYRLRGFDAASEAAFAGAGITQIAHLSGHDAGDLAARSGVAFDRVLPWVQVADLVQEVGVPIDAAVALVAAGVGGPRGLREADPEEIADRVAAFGGYTVNARDVARWKRRA